MVRPGTCALTFDVLFRTYRLRTYKTCFVGSDAVKWMTANGIAGSTGTAVQIGNSMLEAGLLHHVVYEHSFQDQNLYYR